MTIRRPVLAFTTVCALLTASVAFAGWDEGMAAFKSGNFAQAVAEFQQFVEERPDEHGGYQMLGLSLISARRPAEAVAPFEKALELKGENPVDRLYLGRALHMSGKHRESISTLSRLNIGSLALKKQSQVYQMRGASYARLGNTGSAAADLGRVADLNSSDAGARFEYGRMLQNDAQLDPAIVAYERAVSMGGSQTEWKKALVNALKLKGRSTPGSAKVGVYRKAEDYARSLVGSSASYDNLPPARRGAARGQELRLGGLDAASRPISKRNNDWHAHLYLGQAYGSLERLQRCRSAAERRSRPCLGVMRRSRSSTTSVSCSRSRRSSTHRSRPTSAPETRAARPGSVRTSRSPRRTREADEFNATVAELEAQRDALREQLAEVPGATNEPPRR